MKLYHYSSNGPNRSLIATVRTVGGARDFLRQNGNVILVEEEDQDNPGCWDFLTDSGQFSLEDE